MHKDNDDSPDPLDRRLRSLAEQVFRVIDELDKSQRTKSLVSGETGQHPVIRRTRPALPHSRVIRDILRRRRLRAKFFDGDWFADPAWDMLLDLAAARSEGAQVSVSSLCLASGVPPTTALRWINHMAEADLLLRTSDPVDRRRAFVELSDEALRKLADYFEAIGVGSRSLI